MLSRIILLAISGYFLLTMGYALWHADAYASGLHHILRYVAGPALLAAIFLLAALGLPRSVRTMTAVYSAAILGTLFLFEGVLTWQTFRIVSGVAGEAGADTEDRSAYTGGLPPARTLKDLNHSLGVTDTTDVMLGGIPDRDVLLCHRASGPVTYTADRYGFRNDDSIHDGPVDVLLLGDSFVEGVCLGEGEHLAAQLGALGPRVMNTGSRGAGPLFELAILERFGPKLRPPWTVMVFFSGNDWENLQKSRQFDWLTTAVDGGFKDTPLLPDGSRLDAARDLVGAWWEERGTPVSERLRHTKTLRNFAGLQKTSLALGLHFPQAPKPVEGHERIYRRAVETVGGWDGQLLVVFLPPVEQFVGLMSFPGAFAARRDLIRSAAEDSGAAFLDLSQIFGAHDDPASLYAPDAHLSATGAAFAAASIAQSMHREELSLAADLH